VLLAVVASTGAVARPAAAADPTMSECLSANESAIKLRREHKLKQARDQALVCAAVNCPEEVREACEVRVKELNTAIPHIVFEVKDAGGNDLSAVVVTMDGQPFADHLDGTAIPVDPGDHAFSFAVGGQPNVEKHLVIYEGDKSRRERIQLGGESSGPAALASAPPPPAFTPPETRPEATATRSTAAQAGPRLAAGSSGMGTQKVLGLAVGGVGVVGVGVGTALGLMTMSSWSSVTSACGSGGASHCVASNPSAVRSDQNTAQTDGTISTVAFVAGGVMLAGGAVLFLVGGEQGHEALAKPTIAVTPAVGSGQAGFSLVGGF
jgi:hypothetical protein